jgi:hypothetical protein
MAINDPDTYVEYYPMTGATLPAIVQSGSGSRESKVFYIPTPFASKYAPTSTLLVGCLSGFKLTPNG